MLCYLPILLLAVSAITAGEEVACITTKESCTQQNVSYSALSVINGNYHCCVVGYIMTWNNDQCRCNKTSDVVACDEGPEACANASNVDGQVHTTDRDNIRCCQDGFHLQIFSGVVAGKLITSCSCSRGLGGGVSVSVVSADAESVNYTSYLGDPAALQKTAGIVQGLQVWRDHMLDSLNRRLQAMNSFMNQIFRNF